jgi:two-component system cell cycle sensor histidine kinase/response regulator CckA
MKQRRAEVRVNGDLPMIDGNAGTILVVEGNPEVARRQQQQLTRAGYRVVVAGSANEAIVTLRKQPFDLVLLDFGLPGEVTGVRLYEQIKEGGPELPVIIVTGFTDEATLVWALRAGVRDFITKSSEYLDYLPEAVARVLKHVRTERQLAESQARLAGIIESAKDAIIVAETGQQITLFNAAAEQMFRCPAAQALGQPLRRFIPSELQPVSNGANGSSHQVADSVTHLVKMGHHGVRADGEEFPLEAATSRVQIAGRKIHTVVVRDVTARKRAEETLAKSEAMLRLVWDSSVDGMRLTDAAGTMIMVNQAFSDLVGKPRRELEGQSFSLIHAEEVREHNLRTYQERFSSRTILEHFETKVTLWNGKSCWLDLANSLLELPGQPPLLLTVFRDITERKRAEEQIREQAALLEKATDAILVCDLQDRILFWNHGAERLYGWTSAEAVGRVAGELLYKARSPELETAQRLERENGEWTGELYQVKKDGKSLIVESRRTLVRDEQGQPKAKLVINSDITHKRRLEAQFYRAQRMESLGTLAGGIAHDLNNVLTPILMVAELLKIRLTDPAYHSLLATLQASAERGADMVKQVLSFARGTEGQRVPLQLNYVIRDIMKMLKHTLPKSIDIQTFVADDLWTVSADATQLHQVLMNLCVNARDAMPQGGCLTISAENRSFTESDAGAHPGSKPGPYLLLSVADSGTGIPAAILGKIFDPFFTTKEVGKGTGLGLATVRSIVKDHGGFIKVSSEVGSGTTFSLYFPVAETPDAASGAARTLPAGAGELLLVVDDEASIREITKATLEAHNYRVLTAAGGSDAVVLYAKQQGAIQAVIIDMMMPTMDGPATIKALKQLDPGVRVIAMSGLADEGKAAEAARLGIVDFVPKPCTAEQLLAALRGVFGPESSSGCFAKMTPRVDAPAR